jgi:hypothetical protein
MSLTQLIELEKEVGGEVEQIAQIHYAIEIDPSGWQYHWAWEWQAGAFSGVHAPN